MLRILPVFYYTEDTFLRVVKLVRFERGKRELVALDMGFPMVYRKSYRVSRVSP